MRASASSVGSRVASLFIRIKRQAHAVTAAQRQRLADDDLEEGLAVPRLEQ